SAFFAFSLYCRCPPRDLLSFPTRRSSDLLGIVLDVVLQAEDGGDDGRPAGYTEADLPGHLGAEVPDDGDGEALPGINAGEVLERSEEHTSELQSRENLVCRLLLEKKKKNS